MGVRVDTVSNLLTDSRPFVGGGELFFTFTTFVYAILVWYSFGSIEKFPLQDPHFLREEDWVVV